MCRLSRSPIDYTTNTLRDDRRRAQAENPPLGGGFQPLAGELRQIWALSGGYAWDIVGQGIAPAAVERDMRSAVEGRTTQIWLTPHGFIKAAQAGNATVRAETVRGVTTNVVAVTTPMKVKLEGVLNAQNLIDRIETWMLCLRSCTSGADHALAPGLGRPGAGRPIKEIPLTRLER